MYQYNVKISKVVDGDTVDVDIDLGFSTVLKKQRVRLMGIDTPESRTRDLVEKKFGKAAKAHLKSILDAKQITLVSHDKGKFGRILGTLYAHHVEGHPVFGHKVDINTQMIKDCHAVVYTGENKDLVEQQHLDNRTVVMETGYVTQEEIDKVS